MALKPMKTLTIGEKQYEIVDAMARASIVEMQSDINDNTSSLQNELNSHNTATDAHGDIRALIGELDGELSAFNTSVSTLSDDIDAIEIRLNEHENNTENPHEVTKSQVGLSNVDNTSDMNKPVSTAQRNALNELESAYQTADSNLSTQITGVQNDLTAHKNNQTNPHNVTAEQVGADPTGTAESKVSTHNIATDSHNDIRLLVSGLTTRLNTLADSDDETLDQLSEIVAYIKSNKDLIDGITTSKVSVSDIINNLTTNVTNKPLSAAQGVALKSLIDELETEFNNHNHDSAYYTKTQIDNMEFITVDDIDTICGGAIQYAEGVKF